MERDAFCGWFSMAAASAAPAAMAGAGDSRPPPLLLGLGDARPDWVTVRWPGGGVSRPRTGTAAVALLLLLLSLLPSPAPLPGAGDSRPPVLGPPRAPWKDRKRCAMTGLIDRPGLPVRRAAAVAAAGAAASAAVGTGDGGGDLSSGRALDSRASRIAGSSCSFMRRIRATSSRSMSSCASSRFT